MGEVAAGETALASFLDEETSIEGDVEICDSRETFDAGGIVMETAGGFALGEKDSWVFWVSDEAG